MYQSVGHEIIDLFGKAMELPLYRAETNGNAQTTDKEYDQPFEGDEVEDLYNLLSEIKVCSKFTLAVLYSFDICCSKNIQLMLFLWVLSFPNIKIIVLLMCKSSTYFPSLTIYLYLVVND
jgi:diphthamide synthase (EF-2-diphthine--ammonia ligase)